MSYTNNESFLNTPPTNKGGNNKGVIYALATALLLALGYIVYDKTQDKQLQQVSENKDVIIHNIDSAKNELQLLYDNAATRIDSISTSNVQLQGDLATRNNEIIKLKQDIGSILKKKNASQEELSKAKSMIAELNGKIDGLYVEINKLKGENEQLTIQNNQLTTDKTNLTETNKNLNEDLSKKETENQALAEQVDVASTLHVSHIGVAAVRMKGDKEKETETAKRADFFRVAFQLDESRVAKAGNKTIYVVIKSPSGAVSVPEGNFKLRNGDALQYTNMVEVTYDPSRANNVSFDWKPGQKFEPGNYTIEVYNNGFKIGETTKMLKKGGLFS